MSKYTAKHFREGLPKWKRQKDPVLSKVFYRPVSFFGASFCANHGISANTVSYFSTLVAVIACGLFLFNSYPLHIAGASLFNIWLILDCVDGNLARCVRKQPFGEFADSMSSYVLVGLMGAPMGVALYFDGGLMVGPGAFWFILIGAIASSSDSLMRLIYQKYKNTERKLADLKVVEIGYDQRNDTSQVGSLRVRIENELGIGGILPFAVLMATIFHALDILLLYCFCYYGLSFLVSVVIYSKKAITSARANADKMPQ